MRIHEKGPFSKLENADMSSLSSVNAGTGVVAQGLVTNYEEGGGATKRERGGACEVSPLR